MVAGSGAGECEALEGLGRTARRQGEMDRARQCYQEALRLAEQVGDEAKQGELHNTLGILAWKRGAHGEALGHYEQALRIFEERDDPVHAGLILNSIGVTLQKLDRFCEYDAPNPEVILEHARRAGARVDKISEITLEIYPDMFI